MAKIESNIVMKEGVVNTKRKFGEAQTYYPVYIEGDGGDPVPALFTANQIEVAIARAKTNMEDVPEQETGGFLSGLFG